uniref:Holin n=1 Tax=Pseudomonas phage MK TaxID=3015287 RepID=A0AAT9TRQ0_9VIRU
MEAYVREEFIKIMRKLPIRVRASIVLIWIALFFWLPVVTALVAGVIDFFYTAKDQLEEGYSVLISAAKGAVKCLRTGEEL